MTKEATPEVTPEQLFEMYESRIQEQTAILFALVNKLGGEVIIDSGDFENENGYDTILADNLENDRLKLSLGGGS